MVESLFARVRVGKGRASKSGCIPVVLQWEDDSALSRGKFSFQALSVQTLRPGLWLHLSSQEIARTISRQRSMNLSSLKSVRAF